MNTLSMCKTLKTLHILLLYSIFFLNIQHMGRQNWIWKWCKVKTLAVHDYKIPTGRIALVRINTTVLQSDRRSKGNKSIR